MSRYFKEETLLFCRRKGQAEREAGAGTSGRSTPVGGREEPSMAGAGSVSGKEQRLNLEEEMKQIMSQISPRQAIWYLLRSFKLLAVL